MIYDILVIVLAVIFVIIGIKKGAARTIIMTVSCFFSYLLSSYFGNILANYIYDNAISATIQKNITETLKSLPLTDTASTLDGIVNNLPGFVKSIFSISGNDISKALSDTINNVSSTIVTEVDKVIKPVLVGFFALLLTLIIFILIRVILRCTVDKMLIRIFRLPGLNIINAILGVLFGLLRAFFIISFIAMLLKYCLPFIDNIPEFLSEKAINQSLIFKFFYNNNIFTNLINMLTGKVA